MNNYRFDDIVEIILGSNLDKDELHDLKYNIDLIIELRYGEKND